MLGISDGNVHEALHGIDRQDFGGMDLDRLKTTRKTAGLPCVIVHQAISKQGRIPHIEGAVAAEVSAFTVRKELLNQAGQIIRNIHAVANRVLIHIPANGRSGADSPAIPDRIAVGNALAINVRVAVGVFAVLFESVAIGIDSEADLNPIVHVIHLDATKGVGGLIPIHLGCQDIIPGRDIGNVDPLAIQASGIDVPTASGDSHIAAAVFGRDAGGTGKVHNTKTILESYRNSIPHRGVQNIFGVAFVMGMPVAIDGVKLPGVG